MTAEILLGNVSAMVTIAGSNWILKANYPNTGKHISFGIYDYTTKSAVENVQKAYGLSQDGEVGPNTWKALKLPWNYITNEPDRADSNYKNILYNNNIYNDGTGNTVYVAIGNTSLTDLKDINSEKYAEIYIMVSAYDSAGDSQIDPVYQYTPTLGDPLPPINGFRVKLHKNDTFEDYDIWLPKSEFYIENGKYYYSVSQLDTKLGYSEKILSYAMDNGNKIFYVDCNGHLTIVQQFLVDHKEEIDAINWALLVADPEIGAFAKFMSLYLETTVGAYRVLRAAEILAEQTSTPLAKVSAMLAVERGILAEGLEASADVAFAVKSELAASGIADAATLGSAFDHVYTSVKPLDNLFPELNGVNPHYVDGAGAGVNTNCVSCANETDARLTGSDINAVASPSKGYGTRNDLLPSAPMGFSGSLTVKQVVDKMVEFGSGQTRVVLIQQGTIMHVINAINKGGKIYFIDSQIGKVVELNPELLLNLGVKL